MIFRLVFTFCVCVLVGCQDAGPYHFYEGEVGDFSELANLKISSGVAVTIYNQDESKIIGEFTNDGLLTDYGDKSMAYLRPGEYVIKSIISWLDEPDEDADNSDLVPYRLDHYFFHRVTLKKGKSYHLGVEVKDYKTLYDQLRHSTEREIKIFDAVSNEGVGVLIRKEPSQ